MTTRRMVQNTVSVCAAMSYWPVVGHSVALTQRMATSTRLSRPTRASSSLYFMTSRIGFKCFTSGLLLRRWR